MKTKLSFFKSFGPLLLAVAFLLIAFGGSVALANFDRSQAALASKPMVVKAARVELAQLSGASSSLSSLGLSKDSATFQNESQLADDNATDKLEPKKGDDGAMLGVVPGAPASNGEKFADDNGDDDVPAENKELPINFEFTGLLSAINGNTLTVGDKTVIVSAATEIKGSLMVGEMVKVEGFLQASGSVQAAEIKANGDQEDEKIVIPLVSPTQEMGDDHGGTTSQIGGDDHGGDNNSGSQNLSGSGNQSGDDGGGHGGDDGGGHH